MLLRVQCRYEKYIAHQPTEFAPAYQNRPKSNGPLKVDGESRISNVRTRLLENTIYEVGNSLLSSSAPCNPKALRGVSGVG